MAASHLLARPGPTCLACVRRTALFAPMGGAGAGLLDLSATWTTTTTKDETGRSMNGALTRLRPLLLPLTTARGRRHRALSKHDTDGVLVRLLEDVRGFGRKDTILRISGGLMRNTFYPQDKAEYMTTRKMAAEGLHPRGSGGDTAKRDRRFVPPDADSLLGGPNQEGGEDGDSALADLAGARFETIRVETPSAVTPDRAFELVATLVPDVLVFRRKSIPSSEAHPSSSSSLGGAAIFGSVTPLDVVEQLRGLLELDPEGRHVVVDAHNVRLVEVGGADADAEEGEEAAAVVVAVDRIKLLGSWDVVITGPGWPERVVREVQVVDEGEGEGEL